MTELQALKMEALEHRQDLERLVSLYELFQAYVESIALVIKGEASAPSILQLQPSLKLRLDDEQARFLEWQNGNQVLHADIYGLVEAPGDYIEPRAFRAALPNAVAKFEHLISNAERELRYLHEKIALVTSEEEAHKVTKVEPQAPPSPTVADRVNQADRIGETAIKWGGKVIRFVPWVTQIFRGLSL